MPSGSLKLRGRVRAVLGDNVDTDIIYPGRYLNITDREKTAEHLFELAYPEIRAELQPGEFIVAGKNFGCGSSREHAPWALADFGFKLIIAPSFADIFYNNCVKNGILLATLKSQEVDEIFAFVEKNKGAVISADLPSQTVTAGGKTYSFPIDAFNKECLLKGLDSIAWTMQFQDKITAYENKIKIQHPWLNR